MPTRARGARTFAPPRPTAPVVLDRPVLPCTRVGLVCPSCRHATVAILGEPSKAHAECASCGRREPYPGGGRW